MALTISVLAKRFGLSRSTLLYYDRIGILKPSGRLPNGYRAYAKKDEDRLTNIVTYRKTGASMSDVRQMLDGGKSDLRRLLDRRLNQLNEEIAGLREQQRIILGLLKNKRVSSLIGVMNLDLWVTLLKQSGFNQQDMNRWHGAFERSSPESHQKFLEFLCIPKEEIACIRRRSKANPETKSD